MVKIIFIYNYEQSFLVFPTLRLALSNRAQVQVH